MKKVLPALLILLVVCGSYSVCAAPFLPAEGILRTNVQLRTRPSEESESQLILLQGQSVTIVEIIGGWCRVEYGSYKGYIRGDLFADTTRGQSPYVDQDTPAQPDKPASLGITKLLKMGMRGTEVLMMQEALFALGYTEIKPDGIFGIATQDAVRSFQRLHELKADGIVGEDTYLAIDTELSRLTGEQQVYG